MQTIYHKQDGVMNPSAVIDRIGELSKEVDEEFNKETVDREKILRLRTAQLMVGMQLSTRFNTPRFF